MGDIKLVIKISEEVYKNIQSKSTEIQAEGWTIENAILNGTPLTPDVLADMLMEERIRGELKQDISYSKDVIDNVRCKLTVEIIDHRPCYCGAELREVWRESEE